MELSPPRDTAAASYGSFSFPTPSLKGIEQGLALARREVDLAQREREVAQREQRFKGDEALLLKCVDLFALRRLGQATWQNAPLHFQALSKRLWQAWAFTVLLLVWNLLFQIMASLYDDGGEAFPAMTVVEDAPLAAAIASPLLNSSSLVSAAIPEAQTLPANVQQNGSAVGTNDTRLLSEYGHGPIVASPPDSGQFGVATLILLAVPIVSWLSWAHPLAEAAMASGTSDSSARAALHGLAAHGLLCGLAGFAPPGCGVASLWVGLVSYQDAPPLLTGAAILIGVGFVSVGAACAVLHQWVGRVSLLRSVEPGAGHVGSCTATTSLTGSASPGGGGQARLHVQYGRI